MKGGVRAEIAYRFLRQRMKGFDGVTDNDWFAFLSQEPGIDEINSWQPIGTSRKGEGLAPVSFS